MIFFESIPEKDESVWADNGTFDDVDYVKGKSEEKSK